MPFPSTMLELVTAKYHFLRPEKCSICGEEVAVHSTPGGREISVNLTRTPDAPVVRHVLTCNTRTKMEEQNGRMGEKSHTDSRIQWTGSMGEGAAGRVCDGGADGNVGRPSSTGGREQRYANGETLLCDSRRDARSTGAECNTRTNPVDEPIAVDAPKPSPEPQQGQGAAGIDSIPMFGVSDKNHQLLSVGWRGGVLVCQWKKGKGYHTGVPEDLYMKLRRVPFAYRQYNATIKGKYPYTKLP